MKVKTIVQEIKRLPLVKRFFVMEQTLKYIKNEELDHMLEIAASELYDDYISDKDLIAFSSLD